MSRSPQPPFHDLEFSRNADFWAGSDASTRGAYLMPLTTPSEFLAFGVLTPSRRVHFVARGKLEDHLAAFITRMDQNGARVELYVRPPVQGSILKRYTSGPPVEGQESEEPPDPPISGLVPDAAVPYASLLGRPLWTEGGGSTRGVVVTPTNNPAEFFAMGLVSSSRVIFRISGSVQRDLGEFVTRMVNDRAGVELSPQPPVL